MLIKQIPLSQLENDPRGTLEKCCDSGGSLVVELPDHRLVSIAALEPNGDDRLTDELVATNPAFRALIERSRNSRRKPFGSPRS